MGTEKMDKARIHEAAQALLHRGLGNLWYPVAPSWQVRDRPLGFTRLSQNIVLWRDEDGTVHALEDRCPHRGARLSLGWNLGDRVACWYHGVEVDTSGTVVNVPAMPDCALAGRGGLKSYPVEERNGAIFLWFGDAAHPDPAPLDLPEQLTSDDYGAILCTATWRCNYLYAVDNVMDPMHGAYLHAASHSMSQGAKHAEMDVRPTDTGLIFEKVDQRDVNFDWVEFGNSNTLWLRLEIPYGKGAGPGGNFGIVGFVTPVDEDHCQVFFWRTRKVTGWQRDTWRFLYRTRLEGLHWTVLEQDRVLLEHMAPNARNQEFLYRHDLGLGRVRAQLRKLARTQIETLAEAGHTLETAA